jgi:hypothetical protein
MPVRLESADQEILVLKAQGLSFREISMHLGKSLGSVTGRYYRIKGVRHPSQIARDAELSRTRRLRRIARNRAKSLAAMQAAIDLRSGRQFSIAIGRAREAGASLEMIGVCLGVSKQALHKRWAAESAVDD